MTDFTNKGFKDLLIDDFIVLTKRYITDEIGGRDIRFRLKDKAKGRLSTTRAKGNEVDKGGKDVAEVDYILFCLTDVNIQKNDRVKLKGKNLRVIAVNNPRNLDHHYEVELEELQPDVKTRMIGIISEKERVRTELNIKGND